jgi:hypothetical protein
MMSLSKMTVLSVVMINAVMLRLLMNHSEKDPSVWLVGASHAKTCIPPSSGWMVPEH